MLISPPHLLGTRISHVNCMENVQEEMHQQRQVSMKSLIRGLSDMEIEAEQADMEAPSSQAYTDYIDDRSRHEDEYMKIQQDCSPLFLSSMACHTSAFFQAPPKTPFEIGQSSPEEQQRLGKLLAAQHRENIVAMHQQLELAHQEQLEEQLRRCYNQQLAEQLGGCVLPIKQFDLVPCIDKMQLM